MLIAKLFGALLVLLAAFTSGAECSRTEKKRLALLDAWIELIFFIRSQIDCYLSPVESLLEGADLSAFPQALPESPTLSSLFLSSQALLDKEAERLLDAFVREIGGIYREEQLKRCDHYTEALSRLREKQAAELSGRVRAARALSLCIALGLIILLW